MDKTDPDKKDQHRIQAAPPATAESPSVGGMEINLGDFTRTQGLMKSLRLMLNNQIVVQLEDIASGVSDAGRKFKLGDIEQANIDVGRLYAAFGQRTNQWEGQARNLEQQMKMQAAKNPKSISIDAMNRMKAEQTAVRTRIRTAEVHFRRLNQGLDQAYTNFQRQPVHPVPETSRGLSSDFLLLYKAAMLADRPEVVKHFFDIESILKVEVSRGTITGYDIRFDPMPPLNRLYFVAQTGQVIRLEQLGSVVLVHDLENNQSTEMKLVEFVKHVQNGVWLLQPH
jgi:hypothetical protein